jgi:acetyltransferase
VYPINPREREVMGLPAFPSVLDAPDPIDLAIIVVPPLQVLPTIRQCLEKRIPAGVVITAGFGELGEKEKEMEREMVRLARSGGMILAGPNCAGVLNSHMSLFALMPPFFPKPGDLSMCSQSGNAAHRC